MAHSRIGSRRRISFGRVVDGIAQTDPSGIPYSPRWRDLLLAEITQLARRQRSKQRGKELRRPRSVPRPEHMVSRCWTQADFIAPAGVVTSSRSCTCSAGSATGKKPPPVVGRFTEELDRDPSRAEGDRECPWAREVKRPPFVVIPTGLSKVVGGLLCARPSSKFRQAIPGSSRARSTQASQRSSRRSVRHGELQTASGGRVKKPERTRPW